MNNKRKICVFVGGRANYSSAKPIMQAIKQHPRLELKVLVGASALLERYGEVVKLIEKDGFFVDFKTHTLVEGENTITMTKSAGLGMIESATALDNIKPDFVVVIGDRFDVIPVAMAASFMNIPVAHTMGGEISGTIDESIRHAITKFAHIHFPANEDARKRIIAMGEDPNFVFNVGCPRNDLIIQELRTNDSHEKLKDLFNQTTGVGHIFSLKEPFILASQHPVTTEFGTNKKAMLETLEALDYLKMNTIILWPNSDAGGEEVSKAIRSFREKRSPKWLFAVKNLPTETYIHLMNVTACLIGNSSSGIREGTLIGTPVVNIGSRQNRRETGRNVIHVPHDKNKILDAINTQLKHGKYSPENVYGDGSSGKKIADILSECTPNIQKTICY